MLLAGAPNFEMLYFSGITRKALHASGSSLMASSCLQLYIQSHIATEGGEKVLEHDFKIRPGDRPVETISG